MRVYFVWAEDENHLIGKNHQLPWHISKDLKYFKEVTMGHTLVMGRVTFEGMGKRLLPGRKTIILTRDVNYSVEGAQVFHDVSKTLQSEEDLYVIGGREIFKAYLPYVTDLVKTSLFASFTGDTYFPVLDYSLFDLKDRQLFTDEKSGVQGAFEHYVKK